MPIQVKDYVWEETDETVLITVPLKGVPSNRVDIFSVDDYIKVSFDTDWNAVKSFKQIFLFLLLDDKNIKKVIALRLATHRISLKSACSMKSKTQRARRHLVMELSSFNW